jgi:predicted DNA-binding ribbon-helix-helix protein
MVIRSAMSDGTKHKVEVEFEQFGWSALRRVARRQGVTVEELLVHAAMCYLADEDPGPMSRRVFVPPESVSVKPRKR